MDPDAAAVITPHLLVGETILWCGRPRDTSVLRWRALVIGMVGISALVMRSLPLDSPLADRAATNSLLLAILFGFLLAEAIVFHSHLARTFYAVTNQRVIIVSGLGEPDVSGVLLDRLNTPQLKLHRRIGFIELRAPADQPVVAYRYPIPFTNPLGTSGLGRPGRMLLFAGTRKLVTGARRYSRRRAQTQMIPGRLQCH